ncbi:hypothetical protein [Plantactinospora endophytica]|uniref:Uncharacterized protein n=1 Tax=Plantactinospora endophytica TaxID=673535 RepID=A0ABQ4E2I6_9ACTN|nr:hypothetical protein [Plantactinospora endophytica]GIG88577.1 hypothetical protein Pen02_35130 [Plantactinospora endophytica]
MSKIITFFVAADHTVAAGVGEGGPGDEFETAEYGNFDVWSTLEKWESVLTNRSLDDVISDGEQDVVVGDGEGPLVLVASPALTTALAEADDRTLATTAEQWIRLRAEEGETIEEELAHDLVGEVAALSVSAVRAGGSVYCWVC